jgi:hypothetical protein
MPEVGAPPARPPYFAEPEASAAVPIAEQYAEIPQFPEAMEPEPGPPVPPRKSPVLLIVAIVGVVFIMLMAVGGFFAWRILKSRLVPAPASQEQRAQVTTPEPAPSVETSQTAPAPESTPPTTEPTPAPSEARPATPTPPRAPRKKRGKPEVVEALPPPPAADPRAQQIANLSNRARDAYVKGEYIEPTSVSSIHLANQVLALDPANAYAHKLLDDSVDAGVYSVQQAIFKKDYATATRLTNEMIQDLPNRPAVTGLREDIASAERADAAAKQKPKPAAPVPIVSFRAYHLHLEKAPADKGPYCLGLLSVVDGHLKFQADTASDGEEKHSYDFPCSDVREIKKNARVASKQAGFHVKTNSLNLNFAPEDSSPKHISDLAAACNK